MDFLWQEEELRKENKQQELKTKQILKEVDHIMMKKDFQLREFASNMEAKPIDYTELNLPKSVHAMGKKGMLHFYKAKIKALHDEVANLQTEVKSKNEELKKIQKNHDNVSEEKEKWFLQYNVEKNCNSKLEKQISLCSAKLQTKENENVAMKKEIEQLKSELKSTKNELSATENHFKRSFQDAEKHKTTLQTLRQDEKKAKESHSAQIKDLQTSVKQIQKHKNELLQGYKKQLQLIDNLKKQKAHLEYSKMLDLTESEFFKLLDWKIYKIK